MLPSYNNFPVFDKVFVFAMGPFLPMWVLLWFTRGRLKVAKKNTFQWPNVNSEAWNVSFCGTFPLKTDFVFWLWASKCHFQISQNRALRIFYFSQLESPYRLKETSGITWFYFRVFSTWSGCVLQFFWLFQVCSLSSCDSSSNKTILGWEWSFDKYI